MFVLPLDVVHVVHACDDPVPNVHREYTISGLDLPLRGVVDRASTRLEVVSFPSFSMV